MSIASALFLSAAIMGSGYSDVETNINAPEYTEIISRMINCSGFLAYMEKSQEERRMPASAKIMHEHRNGMELAAAYLLSMQWQARNAGGKPPPFSYWDAQVHQRQKYEIDRMHALEEGNDGQGLIDTGHACEALNSTVEGILNLIRQRVDDQQGKTP